MVRCAVSAFAPESDRVVMVRCTFAVVTRLFGGAVLWISRCPRELDGGLKVARPTGTAAGLGASRANVASA